MSVLSSDVHSALTQLLQGLQSPDNTVRTQAETNLNNEWVNTRPDVLLLGLVEQLGGSNDEGARSFSAVLFRRLSTRTIKDTAGTAPSKELFLHLNLQTQTEIRTRLLEAYVRETVKPIRHKIADAVAELARQYTDNEVLAADGSRENWADLLSALYQASQSPDVTLRESAFRIFEQTPGIIEKQHENIILEVFQRGLNDDSVDVRIATMLAFSSFFQSLSKKAQPKYQVLIPSILNTLVPLHEEENSEQLSRALAAIIDLAETSTKMFKSSFSALVGVCIKMIQDKQLEDPARQNAMELMATFADFSPKMCKSDKDYVTDMVTQCLAFMAEVGADDEDAEEWLAAEDIDFDETDTNHVAGEQVMDRLANKIGGKDLLPPTFIWLPRMLETGSWRDKHAALMCISAISEGCQDLMEAELESVLRLLMPSLEDPHPRVRWAACNALGQMSTDFKGTMQTKWHQVVLPALISILQAPEPRVQSHAAAALVNFCEEAEKEILEPYLDSLLSNLMRLLASEKRFVQEQALSTIATVADSAESTFGKWYPDLMPALFSVLQQPNEKETRLLRAKAMECATLIALAVGKERMGQDATQLVGILGAVQQGIVDDDDPQSSYLLHCWGRMCRVLGQDFVPYLQTVMPPLMKLAQAKADIQLLDDAENVAQIEQEEGWDLVALKGKYIGIKTSTLDDKFMAIELISVYAQNLDAGFAPYVLEAMETVALPSLAFFFHDPVRVAAAKAVPQLLNSYKVAYGVGSAEYANLWKGTIEKVLEVLETEPAIETLAEMYQCFYESVEVSGKDCMSNEHMSTFITSAETVLKDYQTRVTERAQEAAERDDGEEPSEAFEFAVEDDQTLLSDMNKAFHTLFKHQSTSFLPHWERLLSYYAHFVASPDDPTQRQWALCILDDVLEFCGPASWHYHTHIVQPLVTGMRDDAPANRQAACYGAGVAAHKGGEPWAEFAAGSLPILFSVVARPDARSEDDVFATENACASIAKVLHFNRSKVENVQECVNAWVDTLPVVNDEEAAPFAYGFLAGLIDDQNPAVLAKASQCFTHIAQALEAETLQGASAQRAVEAGKKLIAMAGLDAHVLLAGLPPETQGVVRALFG
ncbi:ARM repeat-containing protein [Dissoconium aciculare CBS 342.82]|uniref:ARM repeat-containing protein n=1 Tax=Dissoconium aciculare CBS 342.82 TaxID=1314786 RepID=A0A6J3MB41_9PEZI|nr:ARM repeat-containing protein [Dissoconium aciculare CBS 342.82]KAF1824854.1 ARM repeat-containing protein [Dissoconium aciculare CBS 342.82]